MVALKKVDLNGLSGPGLLSQPIVCGGAPSNKQSRFSCPCMKNTCTADVIYLEALADIPRSNSCFHKHPVQVA